MQFTPLELASKILRDIESLPDAQQAQLVAIKNAARAVVAKPTNIDRALDKCWWLHVRGLLEMDEVLTPADCLQIQQALVDLKEPMSLGEWNLQFGYHTLAVMAVLPILGGKIPAAKGFGPRCNRRVEEGTRKRICLDDLETTHWAVETLGVSLHQMAVLFDVAQPSLWERYRDFKASL